MLSGLIALKEQGFVPDAILDVGAYEGWFAGLCRQVWPECFILMVDAMPAKRQCLLDVAAGLGNADVVISLVGGEHVDAVPFHIVHAGTKQDPINTGSSKFRELTDFDQETVFVEQFMLDELTDRFAEKFQLIKLDVQGAELDVLRGASKLLKTSEFVLLEISLVRYNEGAPIFHEVISFMNSLGFVVFDILDQNRYGGKLFQVDCLFCKTDSSFRLTFRDKESVVAPASMP